MLIVTGQIGGKQYESEPVLAETLAKVYGIPSFKNSHGMHWAEFRLPSNRVKRDRLNNKIHPKGFILHPAYEVNTPEGPLRIQYATSRRVDKGEVVYSAGADNEMRDFSGDALILTTAGDFEKYVWYFLHPRNATSPFPSRRAPMFAYFNREAEAAQKVRDQREIMEVYAAINNEPIEKLRKRMRSIRFSHAGGVVTMRDPSVLTDSEVQYDFANFLNNYGKAFVSAWHDSENSLEGSLLEAIDRGLIKKEVAGRTTTWVWADNGETIDVVRKGEDAFQKLLMSFQDMYAENSGRLTLALSRIELGDKKITIEKPTLTKAAAHEVRSWSDEELMAGFVQYDLLYFDRKTREVFLIGVDGNTEELITEIPQTSSNWKVSLIEILNTPVMEEAKKVLINRLVRRVMPEREMTENEPVVVTVPNGAAMKKPPKNK